MDQVKEITLVKYLIFRLLKLFHINKIESLLDFLNKIWYALIVSIHKVVMQHPTS